uniref:Uncharacterized protein n=1 Tax=Oryza punctata TaxID=4537 RepID=A0A0E0M6W1_ORYPU
MDKKVLNANLNAYHLATWADSAKTRNLIEPGSSHENMWLHRPYPIMITQIHYHLTRFTQNHPSPKSKSFYPLVVYYTVQHKLPER